MENTKATQLKQAGKWLEEAKNQEKLNDYTQAIGLYEKSALIFWDLKDWKAYINCLTRKAFCQTDNGELEESFHSLEYGLAIAQKYCKKEDTVFASLYFSFGFYHRFKGNYDKAIDFFQQALAFYSEKNRDETPLDVGKYYNQLGICFKKKGKLKESIAYHQQALHYWQLFIEDEMALSNSAVSYNNLGTCFENQGDYGLAIQHYEKALKIWRQVFGERHAKVALVYNNMGVCYCNMGNLKKALKLHEKALQIRLTLFNTKHISTTTSFANLGVTYRQMGDYQKAIHYYQKGICIGIDIFGKKHYKIAILYNNLGNCYQDSHQYENALNFYNQSLDLKQSILGQKHFKNVSTLINLGDCYHKMQNYQAAVTFHKRALLICQLSFEDIHPFTLTSFFYLGKDYFALDNFEESQKYHKKALSGRLSLLGKNHPDTALSYLELSKVNQANKQAFQALDLLKQSLSCLFLSEEDRKIEDCISPILLIDILTEKTNIHFSIYEKIKQETISASHLQYALICHTYIKKIVDYFSKKYQTENSKLLLAEKVITTFEKSIDRAFIIKSKKRFSYNSTPKPKKDNFFTIFFPENHAIDSINSIHQYIFLFSEASKALLLLSNLQDSKAKLQSTIPQELQQKEYNLKVELNYLDKQIKKETAKETTTNEFLLQEWKNEHFNHSQEYEKLIQQFEQNYPEYYRLKYDIQTVSIEALQKNLSEEQLMISYFVGEKHLYLFGISQSHFEVLQQDKPFNFNQLIKDFNKGLNRLMFKKYTQAADRLYQILLAPILQHFDCQMSSNHNGVGEFSPSNHSTINQLIIIPHDILSTLPFEALLCSLPKENTSLQYADLDYLLLHYDVVYHYSATLWWQGQKDVKKEGLKESFVGFAPVYEHELLDGEELTGGALDSGHELLDRKELTGGALDSEHELLDGKELVLEHSQQKALAGMRSIQIGSKIYSALLYSEKEVKGIQSFFSRKRFPHQTFLHEQATKANFEAAVKGKKYVLIAAHGFYNKKQPELSGIIFSPNKSEQSEEAVLYVNDAYHLDLKETDLVVLSACESGIGKLAKGEGMMAVNRGFLYSGAKNVIFTLFKVYDEQSSQLTQALFRYILEGKKYAQALRLAKLDLIRQSDTSPKAWAGFVMIGG